jgi:hypothetical protein
MNKLSRLGFVGKMAAGATAPEEAAESSVGAAPTEPTKGSAGGREAVASDARVAIPPVAHGGAPEAGTAPAPSTFQPPVPAYGYASPSGARPRRTNYVRIHVTMDTALANFVDVRWRTYRLQDGRLASNASAYLQDLVARDRASHPIEE